MKILFELPHDRLTGVNTFTYTLAKHMSDLGHDINFIFIQRQGNTNKFNTEISLLGKIKCLNDTLSERFDFVVMYSSYCVDLLKTCNGKRIFIGHGLHSLSYFPNINHIDAWYYISKFGSEYLSNKFNYPVKYIPNFIDLERFKEIKPISKELKKILILDSRVGYIYKELFEKVAIKHNLIVDCISVNVSELIWDIPDKINEYDLIIGYGRSIYEAISCGRNVIIYGINGGDGFMNEKTLPISMERNCSGWAIRNMEKPSILTSEAIEIELLKYSKETPLKTLNILSENLNIKLLKDYDIFKL